MDSAFNEAGFEACTHNHYDCAPPMPHKHHAQNMDNFQYRQTAWRISKYIFRPVKLNVLSSVWLLPVHIFGD
jgi:hypothetical protein